MAQRGFARAVVVSVDLHELERSDVREASVDMRTLAAWPGRHADLIRLKAREVMRAQLRLVSRTWCSAFKRVHARLPGSAGHDSLGSRSARPEFTLRCAGDTRLSSDLL